MLDIMPEVTCSAKSDEVLLQLLSTACRTMRLRECMHAQVMNADPLPITAGDCHEGGGLEGTADATVVATAAVDVGNKTHHEGSGFVCSKEATTISNSSAVQQSSIADFPKLFGVIRNNSSSSSSSGIDSGRNAGDTNADPIGADQTSTAALWLPTSAWLLFGAAAAAAAALWLCSSEVMRRRQD